MKSLWKILAVSLLVCCQVSLGQNAANVSQAPALANACSVNSIARGAGVLSKTYGVDIQPYVDECYSLTDVYWDLLMPKEAEYPKLAKGQVSIRFEVQRDGKIRHHSMEFVSRSGNSALDHAAWKSIKKSRYRPIPKDFKGQYLPLLFYFCYNMESPKQSDSGNPGPKPAQ